MTKGDVVTFLLREFQSTDRWRLEAVAPTEIDSAAADLFDWDPRTFEGKRKVGRVAECERWVNDSKHCRPSPATVMKFCRLMLLKKKKGVPLNP